MGIAIATRPPSLDGCWSTWDEEDVDVVIRTEMDAGNVKTRRRFTGQSVMIKASVTVKSILYNDFAIWWRIFQRQGAIGTKVVAPYGNEVIVQWMKPPVFSFNVNGTMKVSVEMLSAEWMQ